MLVLHLSFFLPALFLPLCISFEGSPRKIITDKWSGTIISNPGNRNYLKNQEYEWLIKGNLSYLIFISTLPKYTVDPVWPHPHTYSQYSEIFWAFNHLILGKLVLQISFSASWKREILIRSHYVCPLLNSFLSTKGSHASPMIKPQYTYCMIYM